MRVNHKEHGAGLTRTPLYLHLPASEKCPQGGGITHAVMLR